MDRTRQESWRWGRDKDHRSGGCVSWRSWDGREGEDVQDDPLEWTGTPKSLPET